MKKFVLSLVLGAMLVSNAAFAATKPLDTKSGKTSTTTVSEVNQDYKNIITLQTENPTGW